MPLKRRESIGLKISYSTRNISFNCLFMLLFHFSLCSAAIFLVFFGLFAFFFKVGLWLLTTRTPGSRQFAQLTFCFIVVRFVRSLILPRWSGVFFPPDFVYFYKFSFEKQMRNRALKWKKKKAETEGNFYYYYLNEFLILKNKREMSR